MATQAHPDSLALQRLYHWEKTAPDRIALTQPLGGGPLRDYTWTEVLDQTRRMAAHLQSLGLPPGSRIGLISKNTAHWIMTDFAIWMAAIPTPPAAPCINTVSPGSSWARWSNE